MKIINGEYDFEITDLFDLSWKWKIIEKLSNTNVYIWINILIWIIATTLKKLKKRNW